MLNSIKNAYNAIKGLNHSQVNKYIDKIDHGLLSQMTDFFRIFLQQRTTLSVESEITLHKVIPVKLSLKRQIESSSLDSVIKSNFLSALDDKLVISDYHLCASFLFPYFYFQCKSGTFSNDDQDKIESKLLKISISFNIVPEQKPLVEEQVEKPSLSGYEDFISDQVEIEVRQMSLKSFS